MQKIIYSLCLLVLICPGQSGATNRGKSRATSFENLPAKIAKDAEMGQRTVDRLQEKGKELAEGATKILKGLSGLQNLGGWSWK